MDSHAIQDAVFSPDFRQQVERELRGNILPFWVDHTVDQENGGFYGALTNDLHVLNDVPRSAVVCARILWTYSLAYRLYGEARYLKMARHAYHYLTTCFWDITYAGVYWTVDRDGYAVNDRKHVYAQAFAIYGLSEYYRATRTEQSLELAQQLFHLIEAHSHDATYDGNIECCSRAWGTLADMRLSDKEPDCRKSMNTLLHLMEAYTNLRRVWDDTNLAARQRDLIEIFIQHIVNLKTYHLNLFFDDAWNSLSTIVSYGHDIEASWLLVEAAEVAGDPQLLAQVRELAVKMAGVVWREGLDKNGSVMYETTRAGTDRTRHWWVQAEGVVGFLNAYQLSGRPEFAQAAVTCWNNIDRDFVDRIHGDWFKLVRPDGTPEWKHYKTGPWECPYHHSRMCVEVAARI